MGTPSRVLAHLEAGNLELRSSLELLVMDEADLIVGFGYEADVKKVITHLPSTCQVRGYYPEMKILGISPALLYRHIFLAKALLDSF